MTQFPKARWQNHFRWGRWDYWLQSHEKIKLGWYPGIQLMHQEDRVMLLILAWAWGKQKTIRKTCVVLDTHTVFRVWNRAFRGSQVAFIGTWNIQETSPTNPLCVRLQQCFWVPDALALKGSGKTGQIHIH